MVKKCPKCKQTKSIDDFFNNKSKKDGLSNWCKECIRSREDHTLEDAKTWYEEWKSNQGCSKCGETRPYILDLHHIGGGRKGNTYKLLSKIIASGTYKFETRKNKILKEAEECIVLCSNCHREFHYLNSKTNITELEYIK